MNEYERRDWRAIATHIGRLSELAEQKGSAWSAVSVALAASKKEIEQKLEETNSRNGTGESNRTD